MFIVGVLGISASASAQHKFTGCLKKNGKIVRLAAGDQPSKPCKNNETQIMLSGSDQTDALANDIAGLGGKDSQLMAKDGELMDQVSALQGKDVALMSKDTDLMGADADLQGQLDDLQAKLDELAETTRDVSARVLIETPIEMPEGGTHIIDFDGERWDTDDIHSPTVNPSRLTAQTAGKYYIFGWGSGAVTAIQLVLNGTMQLTVTTGDRGSHSLSTHYRLAAGDYVEMIVTRTLSQGQICCLGPLAIGEFGIVKVP